MIFLGDVAHPFDNAPLWEGLNVPWARDAAVVANLEGAITTDMARHLPRRVLYNHVSILEALRAIGVRAVDLANNHITDLEDGIAVTRRELQGAGIVGFGAGATIDQAVEPALLDEGGRTIALLGFGWEVIQCVAAGTSRSGVAPLRPRTIFAAVDKVRHDLPEAQIVVVVHWNYEMEAYPHPAHRQLAMELIDSGVSAVVGHHPHRVGGIETYHGGMIAYSVGNWWMPQGVFFDGEVAYTRESRLQLALEWTALGQPTCHWYEYDPEGHRLIYRNSERAQDSTEIQQLTAFAGMDVRQYCDWFAQNRCKRKLLPIYKDAHSYVSNQFKDTWVRVRQAGIVGLHKSGLRRLLRV